MKNFNKEKNNIFIFGSEGYIGSVLKDELKKLKINYNTKKKFLRNRVKVKFSDKDYEYIVKKYHTIIYLSAITDIEYIDKNISKSLSVNVIPLIKLIDNSIKLNKKIRIIFTSTVSLYGLNLKNEILTEKKITNALTTYDLHKKFAEEQLLFANRLDHIEAIILRFSNVYGLSSSKSKNKNRGIFNQLIKKSIKNCKIYAYNNGKPFRDFIHINDAVNSIIKSISLKNTKINLFNICSGKSYSLLKFFNTIKDLVYLYKKIEVKIIFVKNPDNFNKINSRNFRGSNFRAKKYLKWQPKISIKKGISQLIINL